MPQGSGQQRRLAAIMFTDMVGYTAQVQRDEKLALELLQEHRKVLRDILPEHRGVEIKTMGDGFLIEFPSALSAVEAAMAIQGTLNERNRRLPSERGVWIRIGIHLGDVEERDHDVFGDGVNIAARLEPLARPGGIAVSQQVFDQVENKAPYRFESAGQVELKNIRRPVSVYLLVPASGCGAPFSESPPDPSPPKSIAVLPFANMSIDRENEFLSDGISEDLITALSRFKELHVPARTSSFAFKGRNEDIRRIGQMLNVATVLEGSVRKSGDRLRITAQLINVGDGFHLWSERFDRRMRDVFEIQDEITRSIIAALEIQLGTGGGRSVMSGRTSNTTAYECYLKGRAFWAQRGIGLKKALHYFELALLEDPGFVRAYGGLADTYNLLGFYSYLPGWKAADKAVAAARQAIELDASHADAHASLAFARLLRDWDWGGAEQGFLTALSLDAQHIPTRYFYANLLSATGRFDAAIGHDEEVVRRDPLSVFALTHLSWMLIFARRYEKAIDQLTKALEMQPDFFLAHCYIGQALLATGRSAEAIGHLQQASDASGGNTWMRATLAYGLARAGRNEEAHPLVEELQDPRRHPVCRHDLLAAIAALRTDGHDNAFQHLNCALKERNALMLWIHSYFIFDPLRDDVRFREVLRNMGVDDSSQIGN